LDTQYLANLAYDTSRVYFDVVRDSAGRAFPFLAPGAHYLRVPHWTYLCIFDPAKISSPTSECGNGMRPYSVAFTQRADGYLPWISRHNGGWVSDVDRDGWDDIHLTFTGGYTLSVSGKTGVQMGVSQFDAANVSNSTMFNPSDTLGYFHGGRSYGSFTTFTNPENGRVNAVISSGDSVGKFTNYYCNVSRYMAVTEWQGSYWQPRFSHYLGYMKTIFKDYPLCTNLATPDAPPLPEASRMGDDLNKCAHRFSDSVTMIDNVPHIVFNRFDEQTPSAVCQRDLLNESMLGASGVSGYLAQNGYSECAARQMVTKMGSWSVRVINALSGKEVAVYPKSYIWGRAKNVTCPSETVFLVQQFTRNGGNVQFTSTAANIDSLVLAKIKIPAQGLSPELILVGAKLSSPPAPPAIVQTPSGNYAPFAHGTGASSDGIPELVLRNNSAGLNEVKLSNGSYIGWTPGVGLTLK
jgi:hypothetical protein